MSEIMAAGVSRRMKTLLPLEAMVAELVKQCDRILAELDRCADIRAKLIELAPTASTFSIDNETNDSKPI